MGKRTLLIIGIVVFSCSTILASEQEHDTEHKKFEPGDFLFDHIKDAHDWHILNIGEKHISIPLPVILYSKQQGLVAFWSTKFHHGHQTFKNFKLLTKDELGEKKGTIIEKLPDGTISAPLDISITKNITALFASIALLLWVFIKAGNMYKRGPNMPPSGIQSFVEPVIIFIRDEVAIPSIGEKKYERFMPYLLTVFFFIWFNNMLGLIPIPPGGANLTGNIAVTMVLALFTFVITTINGNKNYWQHIFNAPGVPLWLKLPIPLMPLIEFLGIFIKPLVLMIRLFANISGGHLIVLGFLSLIFIFGEMQQALGYGVSVVSVFFVVFISFLELLVAFIQAFVFTFLSALYFGMATEEHH